MKYALALVMLLTTFAAPAIAQTSPEPTPDAARAATREQLRTLLADAGDRADVNVHFHQSTKNPWNFAGSITDGLTNSESLEIVVSVSKVDTIDFLVYPHFKGGYINTHKAKNASDLKDRLLLLSHTNFLYWATDEERDVYSGYTITLESGFPKEAILVVLESIRNTDKYVGQLGADM